ncbi:chromosome segregation protein SMC [Thalassotalea piscium]|uniref:Chromosome partition protein Smc n=1 Tax=Thalassotalea piscium TaxID=1230533 RepID=A0A7X0TSM1_9GAMM|nr:chromosome segregation protein SMC [Thalassotalea piscium]MBB6542266.1 chromosome segregation protein [Thalassotalea piscium]
MRLKHIKLAGFKSFVDQTKVSFEHDMTAIVGPNGCGKSNIIDAVRWVLGESSAKNLRGDAMTDVIFNGANTRKAVGQASVELVFDNISGRLDGSMADRNEVSIRRVVNRDSQNTYYLNGTKCRRRDITDIFLGTGLGPRSYAIIEQGTISRLIESKPHELRVFIEEAAGISKYKERRRDTENRIRHTRENLERLTDIRFELGQQIEHLHQQAEAATRFKTLKTQERKYKAELAFIKWEKFNQQCIDTQQEHQKVAEKICQVEQHQQDQHFGLVAIKQQLKSVNEQLQNYQQEKLHLAQKVAAAEQRIKHFQQQQQKIKIDQGLNQQQLTNAQSALTAAQSNLEQYREQLNQNQPEHAQIIEKLQAAQINLDIVSKEQQQVQTQWQLTLSAQQVHNEKRLADSKKLQQHESRIEHLQAQITVLNSRLTKLEQQNVNLDSSEAIELSTLLDTAHLLQEKIEQHKQELSELQHNTHSGSIEHGQLQGVIELLKQNINELEVQQAHKQQWQKIQQDWLQALQQGQQSLSSRISVTAGWEHAVETVLAEALKADMLIGNLNEWPISLVTENTESTPEIIRLIKYAEPKNESKTNSDVGNTLATKVSLKNEDNSVLYSILSQVYLAENYSEAKERIASLKPHQSVVCSDGTWIGHDFLYKGALSTEQGFFQQQEKLLQLKKKLSEQESSLEGLLLIQQVQTDTITQTKSTITKDEVKLKSLQQQITDQEQQQALTLQRQQQVSKQQDELIQERLSLTLLLNKEQQLLAEHLQEQSQSDQFNNAKYDERLTDDKALAEKNEQLQIQVKELQQTVQLFQQKKHALELLIEQSKQQYQHGQINVERYHDTINQLTEQQQANHQLLEDNTAPFIEDEHQLQSWLTELGSVEEKITALHQQVITLEQQLEQNEQLQQQKLKQLEQLNVALNQLNLNHESARLKAENAHEQIIEMGQHLESVKQNIPQNATESQWQAQIIRLAKDIGQLGPINLAAIDEYNSQLTRKNYLDQQDEDLNLAISTLESAIAKIDRESRQKFKATFDQVNIDLQQLFPKVFGGGQAYLTLTGEDLLETGVTIMARPPGKKNSTIHLLSGGEKALTALSLVFAIFRLNPAPFCMLDEVDAPLDDANVGRFCNLVREMSQTVQFVYISHNKIAMEMASHLTGVTMFEAGVSRIVSVDIDEAIAMAEVS